jgi:hypothetical protein
VGGGALGLARDCGARCGTPWLTFQSSRDCAGDAGLAAGPAPPLTRFIGVRSALARFALGPALSWRRKIDPGAPRLGKTNRNHLPGRPCSMFATSNLADLLVNELTRLRCGRLARALRSSSLLDGAFFWHEHLLSAACRRDVRGSTCAFERQDAYVFSSPAVNAHISRIDPSSASDEPALLPIAWPEILPLADRR